MLDKLLDAHLDSTITSEEYIAKKQKLLNQKIDLRELLHDFERKGNRWLELSKQFILDSNKGIIIASEENLEAKRDFLKKIGSNPRLASRSLSLDFKNPWRILAETETASLRDAPNFAENSNLRTELCILNKIRTFFQNNPNETHHQNTQRIKARAV